MSTTMPETISYGKVVGRFIQAVGDSVDPDFLPNAAAISGNVMFTPANPLSKELEAVPQDVKFVIVDGRRIWARTLMYELLSAELPDRWSWGSPFE